MTRRVDLVRMTVCLLGGFGLYASGVAAQSSVIVRWSGDRLSVHAAGSSVAGVLSEVERQTGMRIRGLERATGRLDVHFDGEPLVAGLRRLLEDFNYLVVLSPDRPTVWIHSRIAESSGHNAARAATEIGEVRQSPSGDVDSDDRRDRERQEEIDAAARVGAASVESLLDVVDRGSTAERVGALRVLAKRDPKSAATAAAAAIDDAAPALSGAAMQVLSEIDHPAASAAIGEMVRHPNLAIRLAALELLFVRNDPESLQYVHPVVDDPNATFRARAIELVKRLERRSVVK